MQAVNIKWNVSLKDILDAFTTVLSASEVANILQLDQKRYAEMEKAEIKRAVQDHFAAMTPDERADELGLPKELDIPDTAYWTKAYLKEDFVEDLKGCYGYEVESCEIADGSIPNERLRELLTRCISHELANANIEYDRELLTDVLGLTEAELEELGYPDIFTEEEPEEDSTGHTNEVVTFGVALLEKEEGSGLTRDEAALLATMVHSTEAYPFEVEHEGSSAMGFIGTDTADELCYLYDGLQAYIRELLDDIDKESVTQTYLYEQGTTQVWVYLTRTLPKMYYLAHNQPDMEIHDDTLMAVWEYADEGHCGDYCPDDPEDEQLLRFYASMKDEQGDWQELDSASYCTQIPVNSNPETREKALWHIFLNYRKALDDLYPPDVSVKKLGERLSYICPEEFEKEE